MNKALRNIADRFLSRGFLHAAVSGAAPEPSLQPRTIAEAARATPANESIPPDSLASQGYGPLEANKTRHDGLVARLLLRQQYLQMRDIKADLSWYPFKPERICWAASGEGYVPDVTATNLTGDRVIYEVETAETIGVGHTREQCRLFGAYAQQHGARFVLVVPMGHEAKASQQLTAWGVAGTVYGI
jgi:hypothetical protein